MTGWEMILEKMMPIFIKAIPRDLWEKAGQQTEYAMNKLREMDARLEQFEANQARTINALERIEDATTRTTETAPSNHPGPNHGRHEPSNTAWLQLARLLRPNDDNTSPHPAVWTNTKSG